jgi:uncharacterized coiled-coil DUF342 family protein
MTVDIVEMLREWADNAEEQGVENVVTGLQDAANEIERLRAERDEANANAKLYRDERDEARRMACEYEARYVEERDYPLDPPDEGNIQRDTRRIAAERNWDCFKEDGCSAQQ